MIDWLIDDYLSSGFQGWALINSDYLLILFRIIIFLLFFFFRKVALTRSQSKEPHLRVPAPLCNDPRGHKLFFYKTPVTVFCFSFFLLGRTWIERWDKAIRKRISISLKKKKKKILKIKYGVIMLITYSGFPLQGTVR